MNTRKRGRKIPEDNEGYQIMQEVLTLDEAAKYIRVSDKTLREMARSGRIPGQKVGREWRFLRDALRAWLQHGISSGSAAEIETVSGETNKVAEPLVQYKVPFAGFRDTGFRENHERALHRWVPWIAGFSASFVDGVLAQITNCPPETIVVLDPFAGVGTTLVEAMKNGHHAIGFEINPYAALACKVKTTAHECNVDILGDRIERFRRFAGNGNAVPVSRPPAGFKSRIPFFSPDIERQVLLFFDFLKDEKLDWVRDLFRVAMGAVMVGFSNYSYEPSLGTRTAAGKPNVERADVGQIVAGKLDEMMEDIIAFQDMIGGLSTKPKADVYSASFLDDAQIVAPRSVDVLVTSPPYLNNYHYIRNTRPQMYWLGMVSSPADTKEMEHKSFGQFWQTVRSGPRIDLNTNHAELRGLIEVLREHNRDKGAYGGAGWANYACTYFNDCLRFCRRLKEVMRPGGILAVVIGNNILQGIEFKTDRFFAEIAGQVGFDLVDIHQVRAKRTGTSIVDSSVRARTMKKRTHLYESVVELRAPSAPEERHGRGQ